MLTIANVPSFLFLYFTLITLPYLPILIRRVCDQNNLEGMYTKIKK